MNPNKQRWCLWKKRMVGSKGSRLKNKSGWGGQEKETFLSFFKRRLLLSFFLFLSWFCFFLIHGFCLYFVIVSLCFLMFSGFCFFLIPICFFLILICFFWSLFVFFLIPLPQMDPSCPSLTRRAEARRHTIGTVTSFSFRRAEQSHCSIFPDYCNFLFSWV